MIYLIILIFVLALYSELQFTIYKSCNTIELYKNLRGVNIYIDNHAENSNAFTVGIIKHSIIISKQLVYKLTELELNAILLHEVGHVKNKHSLINQIVTTAYIGLVWFTISLTDLQSIAFIIIAILFIYLSRKRLNYIQESEADNYSARTDKISLISGLTKISSNKKTFTHLGTKKRVQLIK